MLSKKQKLNNNENGRTTPHYEKLNINRPRDNNFNKKLLLKP